RRLTEDLHNTNRKHRLLFMLDEFPALGRLDFFESRQNPGKWVSQKKVGFRHLLRVLVSNTGHLPIHAVTLISGAPGAMIGPWMAERTHG
ncbi:MAG: hypothetical protein R6U98_19930, partial [Pirellulaceae bacterium]